MRESNDAPPEGFALYVWNFRGNDKFHRNFKQWKTMDATTAPSPQNTGRNQIYFFARKAPDVFNIAFVVFMEEECIDFRRVCGSFRKDLRRCFLHEASRNFFQATRLHMTAVPDVNEMMHQIKLTRTRMSDSLYCLEEIFGSWLNTSWTETIVFTKQDSQCLQDKQHAVRSN